MVTIKESDVSNKRCQQQNACSFHAQIYPTRGAPVVNEFRSGTEYQKTQIEMAGAYSTCRKRTTCISSGDGAKHSGQIRKPPDGCSDLSLVRSTGSNRVRQRILARVGAKFEIIPASWFMVKWTLTGLARPSFREGKTTKRKKESRKNRINDLLFYFILAS